MNRVIILLALALSTVVWRGISEDEVRRPIHLRQRAEEVMGFAQAYQVGNTVYVSSLSGKGSTVGAQLKSIYRSLLGILEEVEAERRYIVKETVYTTDMAQLLAANEVRKKFYADHLPASSFVGVERLMIGSSLVEVEVVIELP